jgi:hypothetical protein
LFHRLYINKDKEEEHYYLVEFYTENPNSDPTKSTINVLRIWYKFNSYCEMFVDYLLNMQKNHSNLNHVAVYNLEENFLGKLTFDINNQIVIAQIGNDSKEYHILKLKLKPEGQLTKVSELVLWYFDTENEKAIKKSFYILSTRRPNITMYIEQLDSVLKGFENNKCRFIQASSRFENIYLPSETPGLVLESSEIKQELKYYPITLLKDTDFLLVYTNFFKLSFSYVFKDQKEFFQKTVYLNIKQEQISHFVKTWNLGLNCYENTVVYDDKVISSDLIEKNLKSGLGTFAFSNINGVRIFTVSDTDKLEQWSKVELLKNINERYAYKIGLNYYSLLGKDIAYCATLIYQFSYMFNTKQCPKDNSLSAISLDDKKAVELARSDNLTIRIGKEQPVGPISVATHILEIQHSYHKSNLVNKIILVEPITLELIRNNDFYADKLVIKHNQKNNGGESLYFNTRIFKICGDNYQPFGEFKIVDVTKEKTKKKLLHLRNK